MANEPERPIEQILRAAARKRRNEAGAPFELHPATRRVLQGEVSRQFAKPRPEAHSFFPLLVQLWPRFAWAVAIFAVLGVTVWLLLPGISNDEQEALLAQNESMRQARLDKAPAAPPPAEPPTLALQPTAGAQANHPAAAYVNTAQPEPSKPARQLATQPQPVAKDSLAAKTDGSAREKLSLAAAPAPADRQKAAEVTMAAPGGSSAARPAEVANGAFQQRYGLAATPASPARAPAASSAPAPVAPAPAAAPMVASAESAPRTRDESGPFGTAYKSLSPADSANRPRPASAATDRLPESATVALKKAKNVGAVQRFVQVAPGPGTEAEFADKAKFAQPVLAAFQVEQAGRELWITDGDGSVYEGSVQLADTARRVRAIKAEAPASSRAPQAVGVALEEKAAAGVDLDQYAPQSYSFRVTGTNRTLRKKVEFTGNLVAATNLILLRPAATNLWVGSRAAKAPTGSDQLGVLPLVNARITGKVKIGSGKAVEINALPASP